MVFVIWVILFSFNPELFGHGCTSAKDNLVPDNQSSQEYSVNQLFMIQTIWEDLRSLTYPKIRMEQAPMSTPITKKEVRWWGPGCTDSKMRRLWPDGDRQGKDTAVLPLSVACIMETCKMPKLQSWSVWCTGEWQWSEPKMVLQALRKRHWQYKKPTWPRMKPNWIE